MSTSPATINYTRQIQRLVRNQLPDEAFRPNHRQLWHFVGHLVVLVSSYAAVRALPLWVAPLFGIVIGHSMACMVFLGHAVTHNSVVRGRWKILAETLVWTTASIPAISWKASHNDIHHRQSNTERDFFRYFHTGEDTFFHRAVTLLFYPNRHLPWNPLLPIIFPLVSGSLYVAAYLPERIKVPWVAQRVSIDLRGKLRLALELALIVAMHRALGAFVGDGWRYLLSTWVGIYVASGIGVIYIFTQHSLHELAPSHDPVPYTTSIRVGRLFDFLHLHMSCHVAHHVFESMNTNYHPMVEELVKEHFPEVYQRLPVGEALRKVMQNPLLKAPPASAGAAH